MKIILNEEFNGAKCNVVEDKLEAVLANSFPHCCKVA